MFVEFFTLFLALCHSLSAHPADAPSNKPLFVPTYSNYPTLIHLNPSSGYASLESASSYPLPVYDQGQLESWDSAQRQFPYQSIMQRLVNFLPPGKLEKSTLPSHDHANEDDYKQSQNKLSYDDIKYELHDVDSNLKYKRSLTYTSWTPPTLSSTNNLDDRVQPPLASRSVPFGPYTTWLPLNDPLVGYASGAPTVNPKPSKGSPLKKTNRRRRRREIIYADKDDHLTVPFIHQDYIPVPIAYSTPVIRSVPVPHTEAIHAFPSVAAVSPLNSFYTGKLSASLDTIVQNPELAAVSYNVVRKK